MLIIVIVILPGTLLLDFIPALQKLPLALQPWHRRAIAMRDRENLLHLSFLKALRVAVESKVAPDCFGKMLLEVSLKLPF